MSNRIERINAEIKKQLAPIISEVDAIQNGQGYIKNILKKRIILRSLPELRFYLDDSITYGIKISQILSDINTKTNE